MFDVVIIGAGLGGLQCGLMLAKRGQKVCVVEKERVVGGCLQAYKRGADDYDTGFHYVGGLDEGQKLRAIFDDMGLMDLPWKRLDSDAFDRIIINGAQYDIPMGFDAYEQRMTDYFPDQKEGIRQYVELLRSVTDNIGDTQKSLPLFEISAKQWLEQRISDPLLIKVLSASSLKLELTPQLPLYTFAQINGSFISSAYRLQGSGQQVADRLAQQIEALDGVVRTGAEVVELVENEDGITHALLGNGDMVKGRQFIADVHPAALAKLMENSRIMKRVQRNRLLRLDNTYGMFTASLKLKGDGIAYSNRNYYIYNNIDDFWDVAQMSAGRCVLVSERYDGTERCHQLDLLTPVMWAEVEAWQDTKVMRRGADYKAWKERRAAELINLAQCVLPNIKEQIEKVYTSSPLTYRDYTATAQGSAYGIRKDCNNTLFTLLSPRTAVGNLLLTGQNLNLHGILGTSMTSLMTVAAVTAQDAARQ